MDEVLAALAAPAAWAAHAPASFARDYDQTILIRGRAVCSPAAIVFVDSGFGWGKLNVAGSLAQLVEQLTLNQRVQGSSP